MLKLASPASLTPPVGTIEQHLEEMLRGDNYMIVTYRVVSGELKLDRFTKSFPRGDFNLAVNLLQQDLTKELEEAQKTAKP